MELQGGRKMNHLEIFPEPSPQQRPRLEGERLCQSLIATRGRASVLLQFPKAFLLSPRREKKHIPQESKLQVNRPGIQQSGNRGDTEELDNWRNTFKGHFHKTGD